MNKKPKGKSGEPSGKGDQCQESAASFRSPQSAPHRVTGLALEIAFV